MQKAKTTRSLGESGERRGGGVPGATLQPTSRPSCSTSAMCDGPRTRMCTRWMAAGLLALLLVRVASMERRRVLGTVGGRMVSAAPSGKGSISEAYTLLAPSGTPTMGASGKKYGKER